VDLIRVTGKISVQTYVGICLHISHAAGVTKYCDPRNKVTVGHCVMFITALVTKYFDPRNKVTLCETTQGKPS